MMTLKRLLMGSLLSVVLLNGSLAFAHGNHPKPINQAEAFQVAGNVASRFVTQDPGLGFGKLPESWNNIAPTAINMHKRGKGYYIVALPNEAEKKTLYVLMDTTGKVFDVNFTGTFKGLK